MICTVIVPTNGWTVRSLSLTQMRNVKGKENNYSLVPLCALIFLRARESLSLLMLLMKPIQFLCIVIRTGEYLGMTQNARPPSRHESHTSANEKGGFLISTVESDVQNLRSTGHLPTTGSCRPIGTSLPQPKLWPKRLQTSCWQLGGQKLPVEAPAKWTLWWKQHQTWLVRGFNHLEK